MNRLNSQFFNVASIPFFHFIFLQVNKMAQILEFKGSVSDLTKLVMNNNGLTFIDINASWCPSCRRLGMLLPKLAQENPEVKFVKVDVDENPEIKSYFKIESIPVIKFCKPDTQLEAVETLLGVNIPVIKEKIANLK